ncbi:MAG: 6-carboxytetrahydropterin synthase [Longimicrobiales bacterium]|nr:6-carboxytetrahydropterin synthase [Longimicrobiales bacterium]
MDEARLIRTVRFRAVHHYRQAAWSEEQNRRVFGAQADPHPHDWRVEVHVAGPVDPATGWCVDLDALDARLAALTAGWDGGDLNERIPEVARGEMTPSTENLARWIHGRLAAGGRAPARVVEVRVFESDALGSAYPSCIPTEA